MCLAVPGKIIKLDGNKAVVDFKGVSREVVVSMIDNPEVGDYVIIHAGFAIQKWTPEDVQQYDKIVGITKDE
jgi:hydrogenase expression/formation protein HypC